MYTLYVESPNITNRLDYRAIQFVKALVTKHFESYTYVKARGVYQNEEKDMIMITIANAEKSDVYKLGDEIRTFLKQDIVAVEHNGVYERLIIT